VIGEVCWWTSQWVDSVLFSGHETRRLARSCQALSDGGVGSSEQYDARPNINADAMWKVSARTPSAAISSCLTLFLQAVLHPTFCSVPHYPAEPQVEGSARCSYDDDDSPSRWDYTEEDVSTSSPSNLPAKESETSSMSMRLWAVAAERAYQERPAIDMLTGRAYWSELDQVSH
jgi:hypothetical protein